MPNRILREGILTSPRLAKLGWPEEVFYRRLHSVVDDFGRYYADLGLLHAACYPRQLSKVTDADIGKWLTSCVAAGLVSVYPAPDGERYLQVLDFGQQIRAKKSRFPQPPSTCAADAKHVPEDAHLDVSVSVSGIESPQAASDSRGSRLPKDWELPEDWGAWAHSERTDLDVDAVASGFRDYWVGVPGGKGRKADWLATWRNWVRNQKPGQGGKPAGGQGAFV